MLNATGELRATILELDRATYSDYKKALAQPTNRNQHANTTTNTTRSTANNTNADATHTDLTRRNGLGIGVAGGRADKALATTTQGERDLGIVCVCVCVHLYLAPKKNSSVAIAAQIFSVVLCTHARTAADSANLGRAHGRPIPSI